MTIGQRIRRRRGELGLSQQRLADAIGVTKNAVHLWETGDRVAITLSNRIKLGEILEMPLEELLPPEALGKDVTVRDPQQLLLLERFGRLSPQQREAYLRLLAVMTEENGQGS